MNSGSLPDSLEGKTGLKGKDLVEVMFRSFVAAKTLVGSASAARLTGCTGYWT